MKYWLFLFRPETFEIVKSKGVMGVHQQHGPRLSTVKNGDRFVAYLSRKSQLVADGTVTSDSFVQEDALFGEEGSYPHRCRVQLETHDPIDARHLLWGLSTFEGKEMKTTPGNYLFLKGGFLEIPESDFVWLQGIRTSNKDAIV